MKLSWCPDYAAENYLRERGIGFEVSTLPYSKIDLKESQINGARRGGPFIKELVEDYRQAMLDGAVFPMPILHPGKAGWVILSGNQRCAAIVHRGERAE
jgi:hypothetical protein